MTATPVSLEQLKEALPAQADARLSGSPVSGSTYSERVIDHITHDSRRVRAGSIFACVPGDRHDGHDFAQQAIEAGAVALLVERPVSVDAPQLHVASVRRFLGPVSSAVFGHPSRLMRMVGVTGTNGKTTTTHMVSHIAESVGLRPQIVGTLSGTRTTPEAPELHEMFRQFVDDGVDLVAMEVSSHGLDQHRTDGITFDVATFTNLTVDHIDYHGTMTAYFEAKARLFEAANARIAVVNIDDEYGAQLARDATIVVRPYERRDAHDIELFATGSTWTWRGQRVVLNVGGDFNISNALGAATTMSALGLSDSDIAAGLGLLDRVDGRWDAVPCDLGFAVIVDYAHTPDGLDNVLTTARTVTPNGNVIVVFGCGGDRDRSKRAVMGASASRLADVAIVTSDNPRSESPDAIISDVVLGFQHDQARARTFVEVDRAAAIAMAIDMAIAGDIVILAGKGHERTQSIGSSVVPFDDRLVALGAIAARGTRESGRANA